MKKTALSILTLSAFVACVLAFTPESDQEGKIPQSQNESTLFACDMPSDDACPQTETRVAPPALLASDTPEPEGEVHILPYPYPPVA